MSCGCKQPTVGSGVAITSCAVAALFPAACAYVAKGERPYPPRWCHVDADGSVRWLGVRWYGLPYPLRVFLWIKYRDRWAWRHVRQLPGCGCIARLKDIWTGVRQWAGRNQSQSALSSS